MLRNDVSKEFFSEPDVLEILTLWSFIGAATIKPTSRQGADNVTYLVDAQAGRFILKLYGATPRIRIEYEHSLLLYLHSCDLSFAVPAPIPSQTGETLVSVNNDATQASLFPHLPGQPVERHLNTYQTQAVGQALGELHLALAEYTPQEQVAQLPSWGDLYRIHPLVSNPLEVPQSLALEQEQQARLLKSLTEVTQAMPHFYATLPVQIIHGDYLGINLLMKNDRVTGVLDFEFATQDLRSIDYLSGLNYFGLFPWQQQSHWSLVRAFNRGYQEYISLSKQEIEAMPLIWRLQWASSIIYWTGWLLEGKITYKSVVDGVIKLRLLEDWLQDNTTKLIATLQND